MVDLCTPLMSQAGRDEMRWRGVGGFWPHLQGRLGCSILPGSGGSIPNGMFGEGEGRIVLVRVTNSRGIIMLDF